MVNNTNKIAILIPCYNEEKTIAKVVADWKKELPDATIYVYDNNSTDNTVMEATNAGAIVRYEYNQGKGNVVRRMFREINAECYIMVDGDDTYPATYGKAMVDSIVSKKAEMVIGYRLSTTYVTENKRKFHNFGNNLMKNLINTLFHSNIKDIMTGYRAFSYEFVKTFPVISKGFDIETEMTIHAIHNNMKIESIPIEYRDRPAGSSSKLQTIPDGIKVLKMLTRLFKNYKPMAFFGLMSIMLTIFAAVLFIPVFVEYLQTGLVDRFPTLIVSGFIMLFAIQSFFSGLILNVLTERSRQDFEFKLQMISKNKDGDNIC